MQITGENITLENLYEIAHNPSIKAELSASGRANMQKSRDYIEGRIASGEVMYGVNTGFGAFSSVRISDAEIEQLQRNLIRSHSIIGVLYATRAPNTVPSIFPSGSVVLPVS